MTIPLSMRFDPSKASEGAILARRIFAEAVGAPVSSVHCYPHELCTNQDDMAVVYNNHRGDGSCSGKPEETETMLVDRNAANDRSYGVHCDKDNSMQLDGIKTRLTNLLGGGGNYGTAFVQVLGFSEAEMPVSAVPNGLIVLAIEGL